MPDAVRAGVFVAAVTVLAAFGPLLGLPAGAIALGAGLVLALLTLDAARLGGRGGHLLAETLPGGERRLRRIAIHEAGHALVAAEENLPVQRVLVGTLACLQEGLAAGGVTEFPLPEHAKMPVEELRRWSRVLQAGMAAEDVIYGSSVGGSDDRALLGRLWGLSGFDVETAQREQRRARREITALLHRRRQDLEGEAERLLRVAPRLGRPRPQAGPDPAPLPLA